MLERMFAGRCNDIKFDISISEKVHHDRPVQTDLMPRAPSFLLIYFCLQFQHPYFSSTVGCSCLKIVLALVRNFLCHLQQTVRQFSSLWFLCPYEYHLWTFIGISNINNSNICFVLLSLSLICFCG